MYHASSPYRLPSHPSPYQLHHTMPKPMRDKTSFWMTSNDHFQNKFHLFIKQKLFFFFFWMIHVSDHFIFKTMHLFVGSKFWVSHHRLRKPRHYYDLSPLGTMSDHNWRVFHRGGGGGGGGGGIYLCLLIPDTYFLYHFIQPCDSVGHCPI